MKTLELGAFYLEVRMNVNLNSNLFARYDEMKIDVDKIKQRFTEQSLEDIDKTDKVSISAEGKAILEEKMSEQHKTSIPHIQGNLSNASRQYYVDTFGQRLQMSSKSRNMDEFFLKMKTLHEEMRKEIEAKYDNSQEEEYYVAQNGTIEELTKEKELDMLHFAFERHKTLINNSLKFNI